MSVRRTKGSGQFAKGASGNPSGRPPGSRNHATLLMESLLEGEAEQLTRKATELALSGDVTALRLCLDRLIPPRKDRPVHLPLPPIENVQHISSAMTKISAAIGDGEITPSEGEVMAHVLTLHRTVLVAGDLERRMDELEHKMAQRARSATSPQTPETPASAPMATTGDTTFLVNRLKRLEQRLGPPPAPISQQVTVRAWVTAFTMEELSAFEERWEVAGSSGSLLDIFEEGTAERRNVLRRLEPALEVVALRMTGKSYAELLREEDTTTSERPN